MQKTNNIYFPLCCLHLDKKIGDIANLILSYGIIEYSYKLMQKIELNDDDVNRVKKYVRKEGIRNINMKNNEHIFFILAQISLNVIAWDPWTTKKQHDEIQSFVVNYEKEYGKDAKVKIHKSILFEVISGKFDERMFRIYCAILSVIGDKDFVRITIGRIRDRMLGFKSQKICYTLMPKTDPLSDRQIRLTVDKLYERNFFDRRTYKNRLTFYSTKFRGDEFDKLLSNSIALNKSKKFERQHKNKMLNEKVNLCFDNYKSRMMNGESLSSIKNEYKQNKSYFETSNFN